MESTNIEKKRFELKSEGYSKALKLVPYARTFEILPILYILNDFIKKNDLSKKSVRIVELMAGSGFLTEHLIRDGYKNIDVFEISPDMSKSIAFNKKNKNVHLHSISNILNIEEQLRAIKPHIVISLAGYHHLIDFDENMDIDIDKSIEYQKKVTDLSIVHMAKKHMVFIIDIFEDDILQAQPIPNWKSKKSNLIPNNLIPNEILSTIYRTKNIKDYSRILLNKFINPVSKNNSAIKWFRLIVDKHTQAGHKDVAIRKQFIDKLKQDYSVKYATSSTPWIFKDKQQLQTYIKTFWFLEYTDNKKKLNEIFDLIEQMNLSKTIENGSTFFNWELSYVIIKRKGEESTPSFLNKTIIYLIVLITILAFGIIFKKYTFHYKLSEFIDKLVFTNYILIFKDIVIPKFKTLLLT